MPPAIRADQDGAPTVTHDVTQTLASPGDKVARQKASTTFHLLAGLAAGSCSAILLQPADLLKTRVQQSPENSLLSTLRTIIASPQPVRQLWRGTLPSTIRTSVGSALYFTTLNNLRSRVAKTPEFGLVKINTNTGVAGKSSATSSTLPQLTTLGNLSCGAVARASVGFVMMPITVIKVRYESNYYNYGSIVSAVRDIGGKEGLRGFFAGFGATAMRDAPYAGLYVVFYEKGKGVLSAFAMRFMDVAPALLRIEETRPPTPETGAVGAIPNDAMRSMQPSATTTRLTPTLSAGVNFASSTIAASAATLFTNPPDAIKTRLQVKPQKYKNSLQTLKLMLKEEGIRSLFDGLGLRMARKALSSALAWTVYEEVVRRAEAKFVHD